MTIRSVSSCFLSAALVLSACANKHEPVYRQAGYSQLGVPRSEVADYMRSPHLRRDDGVSALRLQYHGDGIEPNRKLYLNGAPYLSEVSRGLLASAELVPVERDTGLTIHTSFRDMLDPVSGAFIGATLTADAIISDMPDMSGCGGDPVSELFCGLFITSAVVVIAGGGLVGAAIGAADQVELGARERLAEDIRLKMGDVRPLAQLMNLLEAELGRAVGEQDVPAEAAGRIEAVGTMDGRYWRVGAAPVLPADAPPPADRLSALAYASELPLSADAPPVLKLSIDRFGLYPVEENGKLGYSLAIVAGLTFIRPVTTAAPDMGDELVLTGGAGSGMMDFVVHHRDYPLIRPSYTLEQWAEDGSSLMATELDAALNMLSGRMVDQTLRLYRKGRDGVSPSIYRLEVTLPERRTVNFGDDLVWALNPLNASGTPPTTVARSQGGCMTTRVDSLTPTFRWMPVPQSEDGDLLDIAESGLRYDVRIFDGGLREVLRVDGLDEPEFIPSSPLPAQSALFWTVRAQFELGGEQRVTDWAVCGRPTGYPHVFDETPNLYFPIRTGRSR